MISLDRGELKISCFEWHYFGRLISEYLAKTTVWNSMNCRPFPPSESPQPRSKGFFRWEMGGVVLLWYSDMAWASPRFGHLHSQNPLRFGLGLQRMPISWLGFWECPKRGHAHITVTLPLLFSKDKSSGNEVGVTRAIRGGATSFTGFSPTRPSGQARALGTRLGVETLRF